MKYGTFIGPLNSWMDKQNIEKTAPCAIECEKEAFFNEVRRCFME